MKFRPEHPYLRIEYVTNDTPTGFGGALRVIDEGDQWSVSGKYQGKIVFCRNCPITAWHDEERAYFINANDIYAMVDEVPTELGYIREFERRQAAMAQMMKEV